MHMDNIERMFADPAGPVGRIIEKKAVEVSAVAKTLLMIPGAGEIYQPGVMTFRRGSRIYSNWASGGRKTTHQASAPGEPPASDSGKLLESVTHDLEVGDTVYANVGSPLFYARYLELGTRYLLPRPFLVPALHIVVH